MYTFLVAYDLRDDWSDEHYERVGDAIKSCGVAAEAEKSVWLLRSRLTAKEILPVIEEELDNRDRILVIEVVHHWGHHKLMKGASDLLP